MLSDMDCAFVRATTSDQALLAIVQHEFAALVLDIRMPDMSGIDLAKMIKQRRRSAHVPILFLTAHSSNDDDVLRGYGVGAVDYLSKPINAHILRSKIGVFIDLFRKTRALASLNETLQHEVELRERAQAALQAANNDLERRVQERTAALHRAHQGVRENEQRLQMALEIARMAAWEWDLSAGTVRWSMDPETVFGFPAGAFGPDKRIHRAVHADDRLQVEAAIAAALKTGSYDTQYRAIRPDGTAVWITERGQLFSDIEGDRVVGISRDVTADKRAALEREELLTREQEARDEAERQSRLKDEFLATLSHELRTPMNAILGWLSILESGKPIREIHSVLAVIARNAQIQAKLIEDLLDMNRLMSGNLALELSQIRIGSLLQTTMQSLQPAADARGITLIASVDPALGEIMADAIRLQQVLWNLVHNAIKFSDEGGRVEIYVQRDGDSMQLVVKDDGRGISADFLPHVFERFRQQDGSTTRSAFGLGLGLSIAKHLVELHGGTIAAQSAGPRQGATFIARIPVARVAPASTRHARARA